MEESFLVPASLEGERLDRALALVLGWPRSEVAARISAGDVRLDGRVIAIRHSRVAAGQLIRVVRVEAVAATPGANAEVPFTTLYEDDALLVIDKPPGVVVHPGAGHRDDTLVSGLLAAYPGIGDDGEDSTRPGIVHRLDKDTSGLLVVARTETDRLALQAQLASRLVHRGYLALAKGDVEAELGVIEAPIGRHATDRRKMAVRAEGRFARTRYGVAARFSAPTQATLLELALDTGRTHQIRVHLQALGHPVVGDRRYGGYLEALARLGLTRPFLHAARLAFAHPRSGQALEFESPLPADLADLLARFEPPATAPAGAGRRLEP